MEPFKEVFNPTFVEQLSEHLQRRVPDFDKQAFISQSLDSSWQTEIGICYRFYESQW